jgi:hypothetical protein
MGIIVMCEFLLRVMNQGCTRGATLVEMELAQPRDQLISE